MGAEKFIYIYTYIISNHSLSKAHQLVPLLTPVSFRWTVPVTTISAYVFWKNTTDDVQKARCQLEKQVMTRTDVNCC